jgi:hypothetical protein
MPLSDISAHRQLHPLAESAVQSKVGRISSTNTRGFLTCRKLTVIRRHATERYASHASGLAALVPFFRSPTSFHLRNVMFQSVPATIRDYGFRVKRGARVLIHLTYLLVFRGASRISTANQHRNNQHHQDGRNHRNYYKFLTQGHVVLRTARKAISYANSAMPVIINTFTINRIFLPVLWSVQTLSNRWEDRTRNG